jgi:hypothetical protein
MSQKLSSCIHNGTIPISYEHEGIISHKLSCQDCIELIKSFSTYKIVSEESL